MSPAQHTKTSPKPRSMVVAGVMSGTSADGIDVSLVEIAPSRNTASPKLTLLGHAARPFPKKLRSAVLASMDASSIPTRDLARLHWRLGELYGDAVAAAQQQLGVSAELVGMHGQTVFHQGQAELYLGQPLRCTWQLGEASEVAARTALPVVSDFRPADIAVGGQGAPLVPIFDQAMFSHPTRNRVLQNLGGIANLSAIPAGSKDLLAFDSGPANAVIDGCMQTLFGRAYDRNGAVAKRGRVLDKVVSDAMRLPFFAALPPKSCGREQFGSAYVTSLIAACRKAKGSDADIVATATAITAESILSAYRTFVWPFLGQRAPLADATDYIVAGGGAKNSVLMRMLREGLEPLGVEVKTTDDFGVPAQAKEAMAFALLAWLRWHGLPSNVPQATGATRAVPLGRVTLP